MSDIHERAFPWRCMSVLGILVGLALSGGPATLAGEGITVGFENDRADGDGIPKPWQVLGHPRADQPDFRVEKDARHGAVLRLHARGNQSDGIYRAVNVDLNKNPYINFAWKVERHPGGQVGTGKSDQAVKVQLDFGRFRFRRRILSYVFDPAAESGRWYDDSSIIAVNHALALNSGKENLGEWLSHSRNVAEDYRRRYRSNPPTLKNVSIFCDSNDSNSESLGYCSKITFSEGPLNRPEGND